jgi:HK97 family phage major capsid protein
MSTNLEQLKNELMQVHTEFSNTVQERQKEFVKKGDVDALLAQKEKALNEQITKLTDAIKGIEKDMNKTSAKDKGADAKANYEKAYFQWVRGKLSDDGLKSELEGLKQHVELTVDANGFVVADSLEAGVYAVLHEETMLRQFATVRSASNEEYRKIIRSDNAASGWVGEETARPNLDAPTYREFKPSFGEIYANPEVTQKMLDDASFDVASDLQDSIAEEFAIKEGAAFINGNGTSRPKGILDYSAGTAWGQIQQVETSVTPEYQDLLDHLHVLPAKYRRNAAWIMNSLTVATVRGITDAYGKPVFQPDISSGNYRGLILGYPVIESEDMPDIADESLSIGIADFARAYTIVDVRPIRMLRDPYSNKPFVSFYTTKRVGGGVKDFNAIKLAKMVVSGS